MGQAKIKSILVGSGTIVVDIIRETGLLTNTITVLTATVITLTNKVSTAQARFDQSKIELDGAVVQLNIQIQAQASTEVIIDAQNEVKILTSVTLSLKTDVSAARQQLFNTQNQLDIVQAEFDRTVDIINVTISTADSALNFTVGQFIGVCEIARQADVDSIFIALPSERIGFDPTYDEPRDGNILPALSEQPRGWFYNSLVIASAQIFRPRYFLAQILTKNDNDNDAVIVYFASRDFNGKPFNRDFDTSVPFDYETTNSLSFVIGNLVLIEFNSTGDPTIIGFGAAERFSGGPIAAHKNMLLGGGPAMLFSLDFFTADQLIGRTELTPSWTATSSNADLDIPKATSNAFDYAHRIVDPTVDEILTETVLDSEEANWSVGVRSDGIDATILNFVQFSYSKILASNNWIEFAFVDTEYLIKAGGGFEFTRTGDARGNLLVPGQEPSSQTTSTFQVQSEAGFQNEPDEIYRVGQFNLSQPAQDPNELPEDPNIFTKFSVLSVGVYMPTDWFWDDSFYTTPPEDNQFMVVREQQSYLDGDTIFGGAMFSMRPMTAFGLPPEFTTVTPIADAGSSNLITNSEVISTGTGSVTGTASIITDLVSPSNTQPVYGIAANTTNVPDFEPSHSLLSASTTYTFSCFVRRNSYNFATMKNIDLVSTEIFFDLIEGIVINPAPQTNISDAGIVAHDEEWWRIFIVSDTDLNPATRVFEVGVGASSFDNNGFNHLAIWGLQITAGSGLVEYLKTP